MLDSLNVVSESKLNRIRIFRYSHHEKIQRTPAIIDGAEIFKSFRRRASMTRNGGSITQPHVKQNFA